MKTSNRQRLAEAELAFRHLPAQPMAKSTLEHAMWTIAASDSVRRVIVITSLTCMLQVTRRHKMTARSTRSEYVVTIGRLNHIARHALKTWFKGMSRRALIANLPRTVVQHEVKRKSNKKR